MSGTALGFATQERVCPHVTMRYEEMGGCAFRYCLDCGKTHALWQFADHTFGLIEVAEYGAETWDRVQREQGPKPEPKPEPKPKAKKRPRIVASLSPVVVKGESDVPNLDQDLPQVQTRA